MRWSFGVDGIAVPLVLLTALVGVLVAAHAWVDVPEGGTPATFLGCLLLVEAGALATFTARDAVLFFVAFELVLVPMWVLISRYGDRHDERARADAGHRFILYTAFGSTLMLVGILAARHLGGHLRPAARSPPASGPPCPADRQLLVAALLVTGLAVKVPVFPLHTWLPPAHTTAPTAGSVLLAAVLLKMGTYGLVRLPVATVPDGFAPAQPRCSRSPASSASSGVPSSASSSATSSGSSPTPRWPTWASSCWRSRPGRETGLQAALFANIAHGVISALLFVLVGGLKQRWGSVDLAVPRPALRETSPRLGFLLVLGLAASLGLPGLASASGASSSPCTPPGSRRRTVPAGSSSRAPSWPPSGPRSRRPTRCAWPGSCGSVTAPTRAADRTRDTRGVEAGVLAVLAAADRRCSGSLPGPLLAVTSAAVAAIGTAP